MKKISALLIILFAFQSVPYAQNEVVDFQKISNLYGDLGDILNAGDKFGMALDSIGDIDNDGNTDIVVSAYGDDEAGAEMGAIYVIRLNSDKTVKAHQKISKNIGGFTGAIEIGDNFGSGLSAIGDINNDGVTDIAVGTEYDDDGGTWNGAIYLLMLDSTGYVIDHKKISALEGGFTGSLSGTPAFGSDITNIGDLNGDGIDDLAVGSRRDNDGGTRHGAIWILFMNQDGTVNHYHKISDTQGNFNASLNYEDFFGVTVENIGDINNDGIIELAVGAHFDDDGGTNTGAIYIISIDTSGIVTNYQKISELEGNFSGVLESGGKFGVAITKIGDLNNDGVNDIAVGAYNDSEIASMAGAVYILYLNSDGTVQNHMKISEGLNGFSGDLDAEDLFGTFVASVGKIGQFYSLVVGARQDDDGGSDAGAVYILSIKGTIFDNIHDLILDRNIIYSNPVKDYMYIQTNSDEKKLKIFNINGQVVYNARIYNNSNYVDLSMLQNGLYIGEVTENQRIIRFKLIKN